MEHYYFTGSDGCGKTTYINLLEDYFRNKKLKTHYIWIRSPKIFSKPLMLYCRIVKLTRYNIINGVKYGVHDFSKSKLVSTLFPLLQLVDYYIRNLSIKKEIKKTKADVIIYDRHALDTLVDLIVDTKRFDLHKTVIGKLFIKMIPKNAKIILLHVDDEIIRKRKIDTLHDVNLSARIKAFQMLCNDLNITVVNNNIDSIKVVFENIQKKNGFRN